MNDIVADLPPTVFVPTHKSYKPLSNADAGFYARMLVDLKLSQSHVVVSETGSKSKQYDSRVYSMKEKVGGRWKLKGHSQRCVVRDVSFSVSESQRQKVISTQSKTPHAYLDGQVEEIICPQDHDTHAATVMAFLTRGAEFISYNPYLTSRFVSTGGNAGLQGRAGFGRDVLSGCREAYCYEYAILALL